MAQFILFRQAAMMIDDLASRYDLICTALVSLSYAEVISRSRHLAMCVAIHCITLGRDLGRVQWVEAGYAAVELVLATRSEADW
jgi:hypothetical protein